MKKLFTLFLVVISFFIANAQPVGGTINPANVTVCSGNNSGLLTLSGQTGTIAWYQSVNGGSTWTTVSPANTTTTYNYTNLITSTLYRCQLHVAGFPDALSATVTITVDATPTGTVTASTAVCSIANNGTLNLAGTFSVVNYWESSTDGGSTWNNIVNTGTSQSYSNLISTTLYRANVTNGSCPAANATAATITVDPASIGGTVTGSDSVCSGSNSGTLLLGGNTGGIVRWQSSIDGGVTWTNITNTFSVYDYSNITQTTDYRAVVQSGTCPAANSVQATITVVPVSVGGTVNSNATVCSGSNNGLLQLTGYTGNVTNWEKSIDNGSTWTTIANATDTLSYNNLTVKTLYRATVQSGNCASKKSASATITVSTASVGGNVSGSTNACSGTNSGTLTLSGYNGSIVRWQSSVDGGVTWTNITNTTSINNYSNLTQTTDFRAVVQSGSCIAANSSSATVTIFPISVGGTVNSNAIVCGGINNGTLQLTGYTGNVAQWEYSIDNGSTWNTIANTSDTISYFNITVKTLYRALVQSGSCASKYSTTATISVSAPSVGGTVSTSDTVCSGNNSGTLTLNGYTGSIVRWQSSIDGGVTWTNVTNTTSILNYTNITATTNYRAVVQSGSCIPANSTEAIITVFPISVGGTVNSSATVCSGSNNGMFLLTGYTGVVKQWEYSTDNGLTWTIIPNPSDTQSYNNLSVKTLYKALVQSGACSAKYSSIATITVNAASVGGTVAGTDTVCSGSNSGSLTLNGYVGSIVRWQSSTDGGVTWTNIANTTALYNYANLSATTIFRSVVQNGGCAAANSAGATITVYPLSVGGTVSPATYAACSGLNSGTIILSGQSGNVLNWEYSTDGGVTWNPIANTTSSQNFQNLTVTTIYRALVQNGSCAPAHSTISTITVTPPSVGGMVMNGDTVCTGSNSGSVVLSGFTGSILNWEYSTDGGVIWTSIVNTTAIQNYTNLAVTTMYRAVVQSGSCTTDNSSPVTITVSPATVGGSVLSSNYVCDSTTSGILTLSGHTGNILNWEKSIDGGNTWAIISDTTNTYTYSGITIATMFRAEVQSPKCNVIASVAATISLAVAANANFSVSINGATVVFTNTSTSNNGSSLWSFGDNTTSPVVSPAHTYTANGSYLVTLIVTDSCGTDSTSQTVIISGVGINELAYNNSDVIIYPNPFSSNATLLITNGTAVNYEFQLFDIYGKEVRNESIRNSNKFIINRNDLPEGIYFYKLKSSDEIIASGKVVIQ